MRNVPLQISYRNSVTINRNICQEETCEFENAIYLISGYFFEGIFYFYAILIQHVWIKVKTI